MLVLDLKIEEIYESVYRAYTEQEQEIEIEGRVDLFVRSVEKVGILDERTYWMPP